MTAGYSPFHFCRSIARLYRGGLGDSERDSSASRSEAATAATPGMTVPPIDAAPRKCPGPFLGGPDTREADLLSQAIGNASKSKRATECPGR
jgi:hypothetical protein